MRNLFWLLFACFLLTYSGCTPSSANSQTPEAAPPLPSLKGKHILMTYGGYQGHTPKAFCDHAAAWLTEEGAILTISDSLAIYENDSLMRAQDLIIQWVTDGQITDEQVAGLSLAVKSGVGLAGCHGGTGDSFRNKPDYQYMVGGQWVAHPGGEVDYTVNILDKKHPITAGIADFDMQSEQYYMHVDPNVTVLATTTFHVENADYLNGAVMPVIWLKNFGRGRLFYTSLGHKLADFEVAGAWETFQRGVRWASGSKYVPQEKLLQPVYPGS